jgi:hypothetical protein
MIAKPISRASILSRMIALLFLLTLSGCFQMHTTVHVRNDGSGTIEQKMLFAGTLSEIMKTHGEGGKQGKEPAPPDEIQLKEMAAEFGPDVRAVEVQKVAEEEGRGYVATFAFDDIEKVRIGNVQKMSKKLQAYSKSIKTTDSRAFPKPETWFTFAMKRGALPELVISKHSTLHPSSGKMMASDSKGEVNKNEQAQMLAVMNAVLKGLKMSVTVVVDGHVVKSNASYRIGNRITLYSLDFDKVLAHPDLLTGKYNSLSDKEFARQLGKNSGLIFEFKDRVFVFFN